MSLNEAHKGYDYQDLLCSYFILKEILQESESVFSIDKKEYETDRLDDLTIYNSQSVVKRQIKYSDTNKRLEKKDLSSSGSYKIAIDQLFETWKNHPTKNEVQLSLSLAWDEPEDALIEILVEQEDKRDFKSFITKSFKIDHEKLWPNDKPLPSWKRFSENVVYDDKNKFIEFCQHLLIDLGYPKFSQDIYRPGDLERIVLDQIRSLGIGVYPNENQTIEEFALALVSLVRRLRSSGSTIDVSGVLRSLKVRTDFGSIDQMFPVVQSENVFNKNELDSFYEKLPFGELTALIGEPGSGKSWFVDNLIKRLRGKGIKTVKHLCYTDLEDKLQKERITLNVLYGNLISSIIDQFPQLKKEKSELFASNLRELNLLLTKVQEPILLIIDGLDHIDRVFDFRSYSDLSYGDIDIIKSINEINPGPTTKILLASQPIDDLSRINELKKIQIPSWSITDVKAVMANLMVQDFLINDDKSLSEALLSKSNGNPLYLKYLIEEIKSARIITEDLITSLPVYSYNLKRYYEYLLSKLNTREQVPRILAGANFSITKNELIDITGEGKQVDESLSIISSVLKQNFATSGYSIYHESFRRFLINDLKDKGVSIEKVVFLPLITWLENRGFYTFQKSYRYYLQFLSESNQHEKVLLYLNHTFVTESVINGHSWEAISNNYNSFKTSALATSDFTSIITLNQIAKIITSTETPLDWIYTPYLNALGHLRGFESIVQYLSFDGAPTVNPQNGLEACYLCSGLGIEAPWDLYIDYFQKGESIELEDFKYYCRYQFVKTNSEEIERISENLQEESLEKFTYVLLEEYKFCHNIEQVKIELDDCPTLRSLLDSQENHSVDGFLLLVTQVLNFDHQSLYSEEIELVDDFVTAIFSSEDSDSLIQSIEQFKGRNWFYNWLIFCVEIRLRELPTDFDKTKSLLESFLYLAHDTDPFKEAPQAAGLYRLEKTILKSLERGFKFIKSKNEWKLIIDTLVKVSNETSVSIKKEPAGPLTTENLCLLLDECCNEENIEYVIDAFNILIEDKQEYHLHFYIATYYFRLSRVYSLNSDFKEAERSFEQGVTFALAYTYRKDLSLEDIMESIVGVSSVDFQMGVSYLKRIKPLADSVVEHTDGKSTSHFPKEWLNRYLDIDLRHGMLYLLNNLVKSTYDWRLEDSIEYILEKFYKELEPDILWGIARTIILPSSESLIQSLFGLVKRLNLTNKHAAEHLFNRLFQVCHLERNSEFSNDLKNTLNGAMDLLGIANLEKLPLKSTDGYNGYHELKSRLDSDFSTRLNIDEMSFHELYDFLSANQITEKELNSLCYYFEVHDQVTEESELIISALVSTNERFYNGDTKIDLEVLFPPDSNHYAVFWMSRYLNQLGGWYEEFVNVDAFDKAYRANPESALSYLLRALSRKLDLSYTRTLSANLINALVKVNYDPNTIKSMWISLFDATSYRLPQQEYIDWDDELSDPFEMNVNEILVCILFARFKTRTTERFQAVLGSISYLFNHDADTFVKPLRWFFENQERFLDSEILAVLEMIAGYEVSNPGYLKVLKTDILKIYPRRYFLIDRIIEKLFDLPPYSNLIEPGTELHYPLDQRAYEFFLFMNHRNGILDKTHIDLANILGQYMATKDSMYNDEMELFYNRSYRRMIPNIYLHDYILKLINEKAYSDLQDFSQYVSSFHRDISFDFKTLAAQALSLTKRPNNLFLADEVDTNYAKQLIVEEEEWIRIGHYEAQLHGKHLEIEKESKIYGGISFNNSVDNRIPYFKYPLNTRHLWTVMPEDEELSLNPIISNILDLDHLEYVKILWLHPLCLNKLGITMAPFHQGLKGINQTGDIVLKFSSWFDEYVGNGSMFGIKDEIPKLDGSELLIRIDYYERLVVLYGDNRPTYKIYKSETELR
ncbi:NACHT domain-containing protein [Roseivirga pacifica]|uniref:NACHT domain-containing protein n=1 Tax=Roseivirga pacifica TaxID=1267423 RepID=UPI002095B260|nr:ATP-binding protein [Roseivirga pacifica]MCO6360633.1 NACHT domain-containing protein [Roseivirga pacifica]MCO6368522.1 NACHT domain-containing protein [Roseivirga pacifica]MCO6372664.1 NACHT domain-containing protein [Roseivirga pacifica]MCO6376722.1 NACHT domain-containing protein [Roseivirga pacifica]MCO6377998.1 NACHT domain-containing protein [Roseivirga pacifica]